MKNSILVVVLLLVINVGVAQESVEPIKFKANQIEYVYKKNKEQVICRGRARVERSDFFLKAKLIRIIGKDRNFAKAYNKVKMINKVDKVIVYGDYAEYNNISGYIKVFKSPRLVYTNEKLEITSAVMESYINEHKSVATGDVKITQTNYIAYGEKAVYYQNKDIIEMTGDPIVYYGKNKFEAEKIIVYIKKNIVKLYDNVLAKIKSGK